VQVDERLLVLEVRAPRSAGRVILSAIASAGDASCSARREEVPAQAGQLREADRGADEHPGYASESEGSTHLVALLQFITGIACKKDTLVVVTYDEFGGEWVEHCWKLDPLTDRDKAVADLSSVWKAKQVSSK
jgi:hypothetical protein